MVKAWRVGWCAGSGIETSWPSFLEKAQKIKGKVKAAMFYPVAVTTVAMGILAPAVDVCDPAVPAGF